MVRSAVVSDSLHSPKLDFFLLGGGSLFVLLAIRLMSDVLALDVAWSAGTTLMLANLINHPHFAASYQIFYGGFKRKLLSPDYENSLRVRYFVFGIVAPLALIAGMAWMVIEENALCWAWPRI